MVRALCFWHLPCGQTADQGLLSDESSSSPYQGGCVLSRLHRAKCQPRTPRSCRYKVLTFRGQLRTEAHAIRGREAASKGFWVAWILMNRHGSHQASSLLPLNRPIEGNAERLLSSHARPSHIGTSSFRLPQAFRTIRDRATRKTRMCVLFLASSAEPRASQRSPRPAHRNASLKILSPARRMSPKDSMTKGILIMKAAWIDAVSTADETGFSFPSICGP